MQFIDETTIHVEAGKGGNGCLSFRREKFIPFGGPNGGDGGDGGSVFLEGTDALTTLVNFRFQRHYKADNGQAGMGSNCRGKSGEDLIIPVPVGTLVYDHETNILLGDLTHSGDRLLVAQGGFHGLGNTRYKSSVNRAPRQTTPGSIGEKRMLRLELQVLADVGLLGLPNAGKSTLIRAVSSAKPKVADYPFTTLHPILGVVRVGEYQSFVMADIPGLIEGASEGAGLGHQFLRHLSRTSILLHVIDISPADDNDPIQAAQIILNELREYNPELLDKPRWLVLNKIDCFSDPKQQTAVIEQIKAALAWDGPIFSISAATQQGTTALCQALMQCIEQH